MKKIMMLAIAAAAVCCACGDVVDGVWTGAADSFWTNANNWAGGVVPGRYIAPDGAGGVATNGAGRCTATFGEIAEGASAVVDLDGLVSVTNITVTGASRAFTFGTSSAQRIPIECCGSLVVASGAKAPTLAGTLLFAAEVSYSYWSAPSSSLRPGITIKNDSDDILNVGDIGPVTTAEGKGSYFNTEVMLSLKGTGSIRFTGYTHPYQSGSTNALHISHQLVNPAKVYVATDLVSREFTTEVGSQYGTALIEVEEGGVLRSQDNTSVYGFLCIRRNTRFFGDGVVRSLVGTVGSQTKGYYGIIAANSFLGGECVFDLRVESGWATAYAKNHWERGFYLGGETSASAEFLHGDVTGRLMVAKATLKTRDLGADGERASFGAATPMLLNSGRIMYTGPGETSTRTIVITNGAQASANSYIPTYASPTGVLEQAGSGVWNVASPLSMNGCTGGALLVLANSTATNAVFSGVLADGPDGFLALQKKGTGEWRLSAANTYTGTTTVEDGTLTVMRGASIASSSGVVLKGGNLNFEEGDDTVQMSVPAITAASGTSTVTVGANVELNVAAISQSASGAKVDFRVHSLPVKITMDGLEDGDAPGYITVNGVATTYSSETGLAIPLEPGVGRWKSAVDGDWADATKWVAGSVPGADDDIVLSAYGDDYTASVTTPVAVGGTLSVFNQREASSATVAVSNMLDFSAGALALGEGGRISVGEGGTLYFDNSPQTPIKFYADVSEIAGGELEVNGGTVMFTNFNGKIRVTGTDSAAGTIRLTSGKMSLIGRQHFNSSNKWDGAEELVIGPGGRFVQTGGTLDMYTCHGGNDVFIMGGGSADISGDAQWICSCGKYGDTGKAIPVRWYSGTGTTVFRDNSSVDFFERIEDASVWFMPTEVGETSEVVFRDHAKMAVRPVVGTSSKMGNFYLGGKRNGKTYLRIHSDATFPASSSFTTAVVGEGYGYSELEMTNGTLNVGSYGWRVGYQTQATAVSGHDFSATGVVHLVGGKIKTSGSASHSAAWGVTTLYGDLVGSSSGHSSGTYCGRLVVDGGTYENDRGNMILGYGLGEGEWLLNGGTAKVCTSPTISTTASHKGADGVTSSVTCYASNNVFVVGMAGGAGRFTQKGGSMTSNLRVFVGGVATNELVTQQLYLDTYKEYLTDYVSLGYGDRHGATGHLGVMGGTFTANKSIMVGGDGTGVVEVGPTGTLSAVSLVLTNNAYTAEGVAAATLKFTFGADGVGMAAVTNLVVAEGSALVVDMRNYNFGDGGPSRIRLLKASGIEGDFAETDVELLVDDERKARNVRIVRGAGGIDVTMSRGTVMFVR